ncbi:MAG: sensor histidine kinase [Dyadobacter fermentans]
MITFHDSGGNSARHLVAYLSERQQVLLNNWHIACNDDLSLKGSATLSYKHFINNIPTMLGVLAQRLVGEPENVGFGALAAEHGLHRWHRGYSLAGLVAEMQHLGRLLLAEVRAFWQSSPGSDAHFIAFSYEQLAEFRSDINTGSIAKYADLQRQAALSRIEALQKTLNQLNEIGKQRTHLLRESSHDLRGSFSALQGAAALLDMMVDSDDERKHILEILRRNLSNCRVLVTQLMDLARLEAGQEVVEVKQVDAAQVLTDLVEAYQPIAMERGLALKAGGPASLKVECDPIHFRRIIQNLVLNALKHTPSGWVSVTWAEADNGHWIVCVEDTGPGLPTAMQASALSRQVTSGMGENTAFMEKGEGIGLSIVKGLCELLGANLEIESRRGEGTRFQITLSTGA